MKPESITLYQVCEQPTPFGFKIGKSLEREWKKTNKSSVVRKMMMPVKRLLTFFAKHLHSKAAK